MGGIHYAAVKPLLVGETLMLFSIQPTPHAFHVARSAAILSAMESTAPGENYLISLNRYVIRCASTSAFLFKAASICDFTSVRSSVGVTVS